MPLAPRHHTCPLCTCIRIIAKSNNNNNYYYCKKQSLIIKYAWYGCGVFKRSMITINKNKN